MAEFPSVSDDWFGAWAKQCRDCCRTEFDSMQGAWLDGTGTTKFLPCDIFKDACFTAWSKKHPDSSRNDFEWVWEASVKHDLGMAQ